MKLITLTLSPQYKNAVTIEREELQYDLALTHEYIAAMTQLDPSNESIKWAHEEVTDFETRIRALLTREINAFTGLISIADSMLENGETSWSEYDNVTATIRPRLDDAQFNLFMMDNAAIIEVS